jgi:hypothetical protein
LNTTTRPYSEARALITSHHEKLARQPLQTDLIVGIPISSYVQYHAIHTAPLRNDLKLRENIAPSLAAEIPLALRNTVSACEVSGSFQEIRLTSVA